MSGVLRWVRTFVVLTAALNSTSAVYQVTWLMRTAGPRWRRLGGAALLRFHGIAPRDGAAGSGQATWTCRWRNRSGQDEEGSDTPQADGSETVLHWPVWAGNELPWCACTRRTRNARRAVEVARWHAQRRLFLRSTQLPPQFDFVSYLLQQLSQYCSATSFVLPASSWSVILVGGVLAAAIDILDNGAMDMPYCIGGTRVAANSTVDTESLGTIEGAISAVASGWLLCVVHLATLLSLRSRRNRWLTLWGAPAPARLDATLSALPAADLTATVARTSTAIAGPWLWRTTRVVEQVGRLGQCAVLSLWLLVDFRSSFAFSLCGEDAVDCGNAGELLAMRGDCPAAMLLHVLMLLPPVAVLFGPASFNTSLPEAASLLKAMADPDANALVDAAERLHRLETARFSLALAIGASAEPDLSMAPASQAWPVRLRWAKKRTPAASTTKNAAQALASERRPEPEQLARTEAAGSVARLFQSLGASRSAGSTVAIGALHRALPRLGLCWSALQWDDVQQWLLAAQNDMGNLDGSVVDDPRATSSSARKQASRKKRPGCCCGGGEGIERWYSGGTIESAETQLRQETMVQFLVVPATRLLRGEDPVTIAWADSADSAANSESADAAAPVGRVESVPLGDPHESHIVNPLLPLMAQRQEAEVAAAADAVAAAEAAAKAGLRLGFQKSLAAVETQKNAGLGRFRQGESQRSDAEVEVEVRAEWRRLDRDGSNSLSRPEVGVLLSELTGRPPSERELSDAFAELDRDKSGEVTWDEFLKWWQAQDPTAQAQLKLLSELSFDAVLARTRPALSINDV